MRVLWFANTPSNFSMEGSAYNGTGWVSALESEIRDKVDLGLCFMTNYSENNCTEINLEVIAIFSYFCSDKNQRFI